MKKFISKIPFAKNIIAILFCALDRKTPFKVKLIFWSALIYTIFPFDFIPDFLPMLGQGDDVIAILAGAKILKPYISDIHYIDAITWLNSK